MNLKVLSVTSLNNYIKKVIENDIILRNISCMGEVSNFKDHTSGHLYFTLKDNTSRINCVMFRMDRQRLKSLPKDGDKVTLRGRVSLYTQGGSYQLYVEEMILEDDTGDLFKKFTKLKEKLSKEGLFSEEIKRPIPQYPNKIAVVTSPTGAAIRDIIRVTKHRNPSQHLIIYPVQVQGETSTREVINAILEINKRDDIDTIILARGGGSIEDLWSFNSEELAYVIRGSKIPVVTGIGHEIDFTIADFASDRRCATPSQAAEISVPHILDKSLIIQDHKRKLLNYMASYLRKEKANLLLMERFIKNNDPKVNLYNEIRYISDLKEKLNTVINNKLDKEFKKLKSNNDLLNAFSPFNVLNKGYSIIRNKEGVVLKTTKEIKENDTLNISVKDGEITIKKEA